MGDEEEDAVAEVADACLNPYEGQANWAAGQPSPLERKMPRALVADDQVEDSGENDAEDELLGDEVVDVEMQLEMEVWGFHFHCLEA